MNINQIVGIHRNIVAPVQQINYGSTSGSVGDQRPRIVFRIQKIGSHLAGKLSEIRLSLGVTSATGENPFLGGLSAQSLLNCVNQLNVYVGQTKVMGYNDSYLYLLAKERMENHPTLFHNTCAYYSGINDKLVSHVIPDVAGNALQNGLMNYRDDSNPFFRVLDYSSLSADGFTENNSLDIAIPLTTISDLFSQDIPLHLLSAQDITIEMLLDLTNSKYFIRSDDPFHTVSQTGCMLMKAELYQVSYTEPPEVLAKQKEMLIPFTQIHETVTASGEGVRNFQFSLAGKKLKKMILHRLLKTSGSNYMGRTYSDFRDSNGLLPAINIKYNDKQYFPEYVQVDNRIFDYKNQCNNFGMYCQPAGTHSSQDALLLAEINPSGCFDDLRNLVWQGNEALTPAPLNNIILPFSLVEFSSVLSGNLELIGERINEKAIQIQLLPVGSGNFSESSYSVFIHNELQMVCMIKPNDVLIMNA